MNRSVSQSTRRVRDRRAKSVCGWCLPVIQNEQIAAALIHLRIQDVPAVGRNGEGGIGHRQGLVDLRAPAAISSVAKS